MGKREGMPDTAWVPGARWDRSSSTGSGGGGGWAVCWAFLVGGVFGTFKPETDLEVQRRGWGEECVWSLLGRL